MNKLPKVLKHAQTPSCQLYMTINTKSFNTTIMKLTCCVSV